MATVTAVVMEIFAGVEIEKWPWPCPIRGGMSSLSHVDSLCVYKFDDSGFSRFRDIIVGLKI